ncbi:hypothetical protein [Herbaspirillum seropedicae]|uniref:hypothetical protein n=1 Tax=Herbaspirillum seropedicae TaxID=964 RepID=UPI00086392ED|nr:hypothetical protein [Herbaspirillum seropedicae]AON55790.1 hypothetical protein Hsc_3524 [Herbaspirillum seropedicae]
MAVANSTVTPLELGELDINLRVRGQRFCEYRGTRLQLEAEGIIPPDTQWQDGFNSSRTWTVNGISFSLFRVRPRGAKGPRRQFYDCDYWCLRIMREEKAGQDYALEEQKKKLREMLYHRSPEAAANRSKEYKKICAAREDATFQRYLSTLSTGPEKSRMQHVDIAPHAVNPRKGGA